MFAYIRGSLEEICEDAVVIDHMGLGFRIYTSTLAIATMPPVHTEVTFHLHTHVREDDLKLYGFPSKEEVDLFERLITVSGIGPKNALSIMSTLSVNDFCMAVLTQDASAISKANGVGSKGAQRIILELKNKIDDLALSGQAVPKAGKDFMEEDVAKTTVMALVSMGYSHGEATRAVSQVADINTMTESAALKAALKHCI